MEKIPLVPPLLLLIITLPSQLETLHERRELRIRIPQERVFGRESGARIPPGEIPPGEISAARVPFGGPEARRKRIRLPTPGNQTQTFLTNKSLHEFFYITCKEHVA